MDQLPTSLSVLTQRGKVKVLRTEADAAAFSELSPPLAGPYPHN